MTTKPSTQKNVERHNRLWEVYLSLLLLVVGIGIVAYAFMATPTSPATTTNPNSLKALPPQLRSLIYSLRVQNILRHIRPEPIAPDPALPSVMNYIYAHESVPPTFDPVAQSTLAYIQAHEAAQPTIAVPLDPNARSVYEYLRAHGELP